MVLLSINLKLKQKYLIDNLCFLKNLFILFNYGYFHFLTIVLMLLSFYFIFQTPLKNNIEGGLISHYANLFSKNSTKRYLYAE